MITSCRDFFAAQSAFNLLNFALAAGLIVFDGLRFGASLV